MRRAHWPSRNPVFSRQHRDRMFHGFCLGVTGLSILALMVLLAAIGYLGWRYLSWDLLDSFASRKPENAGVKAALWGTIWICIVCALTRRLTLGGPRTDAILKLLRESSKRSGLVLLQPRRVP